MSEVRILQGDCRDVLKTLPDESVHCCVTSPPYFGLRDYGTATWKGGEDGCDHATRDATRDATSTLVGTSNKEGFALNHYRDKCGKCGARRIDSQIGLEQTPDAYVAELVAVFREVRRVLRGDGVLFLNLGDSYAGSWGNYGGSNRSAGKQRAIVSGSRVQSPAWDERTEFLPPAARGFPGIKPKDLIGIPWMVAFALRADGWYLRSDIIWHKPNPMPESVTDRPTKSHEYLFLLSKSAKYWYDADAIAEPSCDPLGSAKRYESAFTGANGRTICPGDKDGQRYRPEGMREFDGTRNKRTVWTVPTSPYAEAHFATFPPDLIKPCILAGCPNLVCKACGDPVTFGNEEIAKPNTVQKNLRRMRSTLRGQESEVLQSQLCNEGSGQEQAAEAETVQGLWQDVQPSNEGGYLFPEVQREMVYDDGASTNASLDGKTSDELEGRQDSHGRLRENLRSENEEISARASSGDAANIGAKSQQCGIRPSQERDQDGQSPRESGVDDGKPSSRSNYLPSLQKGIRDKMSACCGAEIIPGTVLDCFGGSGTTGMVARELARSAILIELNPAYVSLIEERTNVTPGLAL